jgi:hypothetical protein
MAKKKDTWHANYRFNLRGINREDAYFVQRYTNGVWDGDAYKHRFTGRELIFRSPMAKRAHLLSNLVVVRSRTGYIITAYFDQSSGRKPAA